MITVDMTNGRVFIVVCQARTLDDIWLSKNNIMISMGMTTFVQDTG